MPLGFRVANVNSYSVPASEMGGILIDDFATCMSSSWIYRIGFFCLVGNTLYLLRYSFIRFLIF